jgi:cytochrome c oxidase subunit 1
VTLVWVLTALVLFPVLAILGLLMRTQQGGYLQAVPPEYFYAIMTLHGLGMVGLWFVAGMAVGVFAIWQYQEFRRRRRRTTP